MGKFLAKSTPTGVKFDFLNGDQVVLSSEVYKAQQTCLNGIASIQKNAADAEIEDQTVEPIVEKKHPKFEIFLDKNKAYRFRFKARNGEIIASSPAFDSKAAAEAALAVAKKSADDEVEKAF